MPVTVLATSSSRWEQLKNRVEERRAAVESARGMNLKRIQTQVQRIAKKEREFVASLWDEIVPVKATWNEEAWKRVEEMIPVKIETKKPADL